MQEYRMTIVFTELGSPASGRDIPWTDGTYRKKATIFREDDDRSAAYDHAAENYPNMSVLDVIVAGPFSLTTGD